MRTLYLLTLTIFAVLSNLNSQIQIGSDIDGEQELDYSGSVSISGDGKRVAVGSHSNDANGEESGSVRIFEYYAGLWQQIGDNIIGEQYDYLGWSVSLSGDGSRVAIGALKELDAGYVRIYEWSGDQWVQVGPELLGEGYQDWFGFSVSLSNNGNRVAVGAIKNDGNGEDAGHVRVYEWVNSSWVQMGLDIDGEGAGDESGTSISLSGNGSRLVIGANLNDSNGLNSGHVRIYEWSGLNWIQLGTEITGSNTGDNLGNAVAISEEGSSVVVGVLGSDFNAEASGDVRVFDWSGDEWIQRGSSLHGEFYAERFGSSVSISANGQRIAAGTEFSNLNGQGSGHVSVFQWENNDWQQLGNKIIGEAIDDYFGKHLAISLDGKRLIAGAQGNDGNGLNSGNARVFALQGGYGSIYYDVNENCTQNTSESGLPGRRIVINPGGYCGETNDLGIWVVDSLPEGTYTVTIDTTGNWLPVCPTSQIFSIIDSESITELPSFGLINTSPCGQPNISINMPFMRPGFSDQRIYIQSCNENTATGIIENGYIDVQMDTLITPESSTIPYSVVGDHLYRFNVGTLNPGQCINFSIACSLSVESQIGTTLCMSANLHPVDSCFLDTIPNHVPTDFVPCSLPWDRSNILVNGWCQNDSIIFSITNIGAEMDCFSPVRLFVDGEYQWLDSIQLFSQETTILAFKGDGRTWRLEVDQHPLHPGDSWPNATVENCGDSENWTPNLVNILPLNDSDPNLDIYCGVVTGSYDPNDKTGFPLGVGDSSKVLPNNSFEYRIRFQNTGTDTAFNVVIIDTLDQNLNIFSVQPGTSSHDYRFRIYGERVLEWTFSNIMLPDSGVNEPESNGFLVFTVDQVPNLPDDTEINNTANIYFDFNEPIITNTTSHFISRDVGRGSMVSVQNDFKQFDLSKDISLFPNPSTGEVKIRLNEKHEHLSVRVTSISGSLIYQNDFKNKNQLELNIDASAGIYFIEIITSKGGNHTLKVVKN